MTILRLWGGVEEEIGGRGWLLLCLRKCGGCLGHSGEIGESREAGYVGKSER
jgi:hypothetical protein